MSVDPASLGSEMPAGGLSADMIGPERSRLNAFFSPRNVAVVGATERKGSVGWALMTNLLGSAFGGQVFPISEKRASVLGVKAYPRLSAVPEPVDLAVIAVPAASVPEVIGQCVEKGVHAAIVISAGFREVGAEGAELERRILEQARAGDLRIIGPNCLGVMSPHTGINATFANAMARPGSIGFISQSGALGTAILDWSFSAGVGFSAFVSVGSMLDVGWADLIDHLSEDARTKCIVVYMESIGDARSFLSAAREVTFAKPIIVLKAGRTGEGAKAVASHTGAMTGSDDALDAAFRRCGVLRVDTIEELFAMAEVLDLQPRPRGKRLSIVTNAGGPGALAADALVRSGAELARPGQQTVEALNQILPAAWSHSNPIDILGDADPERYARAVELVSHDAETDGILVMLTPQAMTDPTQAAQALTRFARLGDRPILACWMGGASVATGMEILARAGIPAFAYPESAAQAFHAMWRYTESMRSLYETPSLPPDSDRTPPNRQQAADILREARESGRTILSEYDAKRLLAAYQIPTTQAQVAESEEAASAAADAIGYPVVMKLHSTTITHKSDVGGVKLNLASASAVRAAYREMEAGVRAKAGQEADFAVTVQPMVRVQGYELLVGSTTDMQLGPVMLFGTGGVLTEVYRDRALGLPPLNSTLARRMIERTRIFGALKGVRGRPPVDMAALEHLLVRFSQLVVEQPWIKEVEINPLLAAPEQIIALDARVILHDASTTADRLPRPAIRPYPVQYVGPWTLKDGTPVLIRPVRPEDEPLFVQFHENLSERSVYFRYFHANKLSRRIAHERLARNCFIDYDREIALVAVRQGAGSQADEVIGIGRLIKLRRSDRAEFAVVVTDQHQGKGLGAELLARLIQFARDEGIAHVVAQILPENRAMQRICAAIPGAKLTSGDGVVRVDIVTAPPA